MDYSNLVNIFIYLDRLFLNENFVLCLNNVFRLLLGCTVLSIKFSEDHKYRNSHYAKIGGVSLLEMNTIEYNVYYRLNFDLYVKDEEYIYYLGKLLNYEEEVSQ